MLVSPLQSAAAGMFANAAKLAVAAHNIANIATDGYKKYTAVIEADASGRPQAYSAPSTAPGTLIPGAEGLPDSEAYRELSTVDFTEEFVAMRIASYGYRANASVLRTHDQLLGSILDIIA